MKRKTITVYALLFVLTASIVGTGFVSLVKANFRYSPPKIIINSPTNGTTYNSSEVIVDLMVGAGGSYPYKPLVVSCLMDGRSQIAIELSQINQGSPYWFGKGTFNHVSQGSHILQIELYAVTFRNEQIRSNVNSTFNVDLPTPTPTSTPTASPTPPPSCIQTNPTVTHPYLPYRNQLRTAPFTKTVWT